MPATASPSAREGRSDPAQAFGPGHLGLGSVLGRTFTIWARNFAPFAVLTLIAFSPIVAYTLVLVVLPLDVRAFSMWSTVVGWAVLLFRLVVAGAVVYGVAQELRGRKAGVGACVFEGLRRVPAVLGATITLWVYVFVASLGVVFVSLVAFALVSALTRPGAVVVGILELGSLVAVIGYITSVFWVAVPACVVEGRGVLASFGRSKRLTKGHLWTILLIQGAFLIVDLGSDWVVRRAMVTEPLWPPSPPARLLVESGENSVKVYMLVSLALLGLTGSLSAVASAVGYSDLRTSKEGIEVEDIAKVFD